MREMLMRAQNSGTYLLIYHYIACFVLAPS